MHEVVNANGRAAFPIVGVGASSGGLEGFTQLLRCLPADTGMAFVLVQHLDRWSPSLLGAVLEKATAMPVHQADHGMRVEPDHVYVIAPNTDLAIREGLLVLSPRIEGPQVHLPVDFFLRSLAQELRSRAIGVILSGSASDGTDGLRAIRSQDGITFAQDPRFAKFPGMPQSAIDAGVVDYCVGIEELAAELVRLSHHPYEQQHAPPTADSDQEIRDAIFARIRSTIGIDFAEFRPSTVTRRLSRRLALRHMPDLRSYLALLEAEPNEIRALYEDMLIHVTSFFRDPDAFAALRTQVFPEIIKNKPAGATVRMWVAGCATGEEVYSLAIEWLEFAAVLETPLFLQIFGSDLSEIAVLKARVGVYSDSAMNGVSEERRKQYFGKVDGGYRINKTVREQCVFIRHDLVRDPPFSRLDLVSCRNVLIYFAHALQKKVLTTLHYALGQPGFLVLGRSENILGLTHLFSFADKAHKIFMRSAAPSSLSFVPRVEQARHGIDEPGRSSEERGASNDELRSMNEELETAKEELQSINQELTTLNDELRSRNQEVTQVNSDLKNFALAVDVPIVSLDLSRRIRRFTPNARSLLNVLPSDIGRPIDDIKLNVDVPDLNERIADVIANAKVEETEVKDHGGHWYRMRIRPNLSAQHAIDGVVISLTDINVLKRLVAESEHARTEAERANCAKDDFLATLSHELRTPLSSMLLNAQRLRGGEVADQAEMRRTGELLERSTWMQVKLIDDLLDVSRIVADKLTLDCSAIDLRVSVQAALDAMSSLIAAKSLELCTAFDPELAPIWADGSRVQQVASNLLTNAIKFTPRGGKIRVTLSAVEGMARLRVTDTGIGIDADFLPHVFTRFSQRDRSITRKYGGLGLGLALVRHLVELQGGTARVKSEGPGHGASFTVTFPFASPGHQNEIAPAPPAELGHALDRPGRTRQYDQLIGLRVLVVDDDLRTREAVREVLELAGTRVELAGSVAEGLAAVAAFDPQAILCDIAMPGEDGYAFIRKLRALESGRVAPIPALALTALAAADDRKRALDAGFALHLAKPVDIDRLREAVLALSKMSGPPRAPLLQPI